jgi:bifunctional non-homologous end joining protein LigD
MPELPPLFPPMLASEQRAPFHRDGWVFEVKEDGYRCVVFKQGNGVALVSRNLRNLAPQFPDLAAALATLSSETLVLDGEIAVFDERSVSHLGYLGKRGRKPLAPPVFVAFDCLFARGRDLRAKPLRTRRRTLEREIGSATGVVTIARRLDANGLRAWEQVREHEWEGLVAKDDSSTYEPGTRTRSWIKVKHRIRQGWPEEGTERRRV